MSHHVHDAKVDHCPQGTHHGKFDKANSLLILCQNHPIPSFILKYGIVLWRPSSRDTLGSQLRIWRARVISGCRCCGSRTLRASFTKVMPPWLPVMRLIVSANSRMVISCWLPMLTGRCSSEYRSLMMPATRSSTKQKERVCIPSP